MKAFQQLLFKDTLTSYPLRVFIECQSNYYIHANLWIVQGWHSSQAQDPPGKVTQEYNVFVTIHG